MSAEKLAFLQNFYTDVTLYVPAEAPASAAATPVATTEAPTPAPPKALAPAVATAPAEPAPVRIPQPSKSYSHPSAGLERLSAGFNQPPAFPEPPVVPAARVVPPAILAAEVAPVAAPAVPPVMLTQFTTLGNNPEGVVLLFRLPKEQFLKLHRNVFLNKMLQALGLVMADVVLVNVEAELPVALANLRRELAATHIVAFGKNLLDATIRNTQIYEPVQFPTLGLSYLSSATVDLVEYDVSLKKRLWPGLKAMFLQHQ
ncbi:hypothetical protein [Hymenobacter arizonensis]|uniref:Uncharacterized protein n=1 Tax=Hymenobacter arizonensis TaxID=1227077 RepID=A0A1I5TY01_HYMAR|nr:hypothetical protein [Hymenobacter arizonensis]SFP87930.1 hypothetical protein SAMN04515668_0657 [Hymenobacter arizonensis]